MSFGASLSDIIVVVTFCKNLYRKCRDASGEYDEISREVKALYTVLRHLKYELEAPESPLNRDRSLWGRQLAPIVRDCDFSLHQLDEILQKYGRLASDGGSSPASPRVVWDKFKFGSNEMDQLGSLRVKLISHKSSLTLFLDTIQLHQTGKITTTLSGHGVQLDNILDKVDAIAAKMSNQKSGSGSVMTSYDNDDKEVWKEFRRELVAEGFSSSVLQQHKDVLRAYIREIDQKGLLEQLPSPAPVESSGINPQQWLESVQPQVTGQSQTSSDSAKTLRSDESTKEMVFREENMKFPISMKNEMMSSPRGLMNVQGQIPPPQQIAPTSSALAMTQPLNVPHLKIPEEKRVQYFNTSGSDSGSESDTSSRTSGSSSGGQIIRTSDLVALSKALSVRPALLPSSFGSNMSYGDHNARRSIEHPSQTSVNLGSPSTQAMAIPIRSGNANSIHRDAYGTSPRPEPFRLAPDPQGNPIPANAKWTKINRRLVSPEVLHQDRRRYEARPDFVAVLGVLSRKEIEDYAVRTQILRDSRLRRSYPDPHQRQASPKVRLSKENSRQTPPAEDSSSDSETHHRQGKRKEHRSYTPSVAGSDVQPQSGYPNPYGAPPSPVLSTSSTRHERTPRSHRDHRHESKRYDSSSSESDHKHKSRSDGRHDKDHSHKRSSTASRATSGNSSHGRHRSDRDRDKKNSRWRENLTAAGLGGAAASLLGVLSEAAEGL